MTTTSKTLNAIKTRDWKPLQVFALDKLFENSTETVITLITFAACVAFVLVMQPVPVTLAECLVYIALIFLGLILRRVTQDFDESWTPDEIGDRIATIDNKLEDIARMVRSEIVTHDDDEVLAERMSQIANDQP